MNKKSVAFILIILLFFSPLALSYSELIGKKVVLKAFEPLGVIYVGTSKKSFNAIIGNLMTRDRKTYLEIILAHQGFELANNTEAIVLEVDFWANAAKVKILSGTYKGYEGWVLLDQIEKT